MSKLATICCILCLAIGTSWATVKVDPTSGATSNGQIATPAFGIIAEPDQNYGSLEEELSALYFEAAARKDAGQDATEIWARIDDLNDLLFGRSKGSNLDEGGETCENPLVIPSLPYCDGGNTSDNVNDYHPAEGQRCGQDPPGTPVQGDGRDVVYVYTATSDQIISVSLCGSSYDTYLHIYRGGCIGSPNAQMICCSDDNGGTCPSGSSSLTSCCNNLPTVAGDVIYIVVDGWSANSNGNYIISVTNGERCESCTLPSCVVCPDGAFHSNEPTCFNGYTDVTNSGCVVGTPGFFEEVSCNTTICGTSGRYRDASGASMNDVDYYIFTVTSDNESLNVHAKGDANGTWALFEVDPANVCGGESVTLFNQNFERCQDRYFSRCVSQGTYVLGIVLSGNIPCGVTYRLDIACLDCPEPTGRCCYRTENGPVCGDNFTRSECAVFGGTWAQGLSCDGYCCRKQLCLDVIAIDGGYEYTHTENTCCWADAPWCVGESGCNTNPCYDAGQTAVYTFTLESDGVVSLSASGPSDNQLMVYTNCDNPAGSCVASVDIASPFIGGTEVLNNLSLAAGTYFVATSSYYWENMPCGEITLHITSDTPLPVEMLGFDAIAMDGAVKLAWSTASETNNSHFDIMRDGQLVNRVNATNSATGSSYDWIDGNLENGRLYSYELVSVDLNGNEAVVGTESAMPSAESGVVTDYVLYQNYPNPFNPETMISFDLPQAADVRLVIINSLGQEVTELAKGKFDAGHHNVIFNGSALPSGLYFYHLTAGDFSQLRKMVLLK